MNLYTKYADELAAFMELKQQLPDTEIPIQVRKAYQNNLNIADINYIQKKDKTILQAQETDRKQIIALANETKMNNQSFEIYRNGMIRRALTYLERQYRELDLEMFLPTHSVVETLDYISFCRKDNEEDQNIIIQLYDLIQHIEQKQFSVTSLLNLLSTIVLVPLRNSTNLTIQQHLTQHQELLSVIINDPELLKGVISFTSRQIYTGRQNKNKIADSTTSPGRSVTSPDIQRQKENLQGLSNTGYQIGDINSYKPKINKNTLNLVNRHNQNLLTQLSDLNIKENIPQTAADRQILYQKLKKEKQKRVIQQKLEEEVETYQFKPQINDNYNKQLYQNLIEKHKQKKAVNDVIDDYDDDFLKEQFKKENEQKNEDSNQLQITKLNKNIFKPVQLPRGYEKTIQRLQKGYQQRKDAEDAFNNLGRYLPENLKKMQQNQKLNPKVEEWNARQMEQRHIQRKKCLKEAQIQVTTAKKATVKFYTGDTIKQHLDSLATMFQLTQQQLYHVEKALQKEFGELTTDYILEKSKKKQIIKENNIISNDLSQYDEQTSPEVIMQAFLKQQSEKSEINSINVHNQGYLGPQYPDVPQYDPLFNNTQYSYTQDLKQQTRKAQSPNNIDEALLKQLISKQQDISTEQQDTLQQANKQVVEEDFAGFHQVIQPSDNQHDKLNFTIENIESILASTQQSYEQHNTELSTNIPQQQFDNQNINPFSYNLADQLMQEIGE